MTARRKASPLYPASASPQLKMAHFRDPPAEYRGAPFWSWNAKLDRATLLRQIDQLQAMGFGGFHIHARTGLATEYLGAEFMQLVRDCTIHAKKRGMLSWLYDEDRWPSGFAGGLVTKDESLRARTLLWTTRPYDRRKSESEPLGRDHGGRAENGELLARYAVVLDGGRLANYRRLAVGERAVGTIWHAYLETSRPSSWHNNQTYIDTMNPAAVRRFIEVTHDRYAAAVGEHFGRTVPAIFTDEPHFTKKQTFRSGDDTNDVVLPFSTDFAHTFAKTFGEDLLDSLPELFWNLAGDAPSLARYRYHEHTAERFASAYGDQIAKWCDAHGIALTGHMLSEMTLFGQTRAVGEVMRGLRSFQLPGIDVLEDKLEFTTAKQAQSVARQNGRPGVMSELYGVTNWDFDFAGHKRQGDWQAAMGVTVRVPHLAWVSMAGEAKRDYPAAIDYHSPWYKEYPLVENHFARVNTLLTRGTPLVRVAVIHPIESFWLAFGPVEQNAGEWAEREAAFQEITKWLSFGGIDFDFVSEASLTPPPSTLARGELAESGEGRGEGSFVVGKMRYDAVIVPGLRTIRSTTLQKLQRFAKSAGSVLFAGEIPSLVDALSSNDAAKFATGCKCIPFTRGRLLESLTSFREVDIRRSDGGLTDTILHQIRIEGNRRHIFLCNTDRDRAVNNASIRIRGKWRPALLDTMTGERRLIDASIVNDDTVIHHSFPAQGHLLLTLEPGAPKQTRLRVVEKWIESSRLTDPVKVTLSEPNVLLLDQAEWRLNSGKWRPREEILRIDNIVRDELTLPRRGGQIAQPWTDTASAPVLATLQLRFAIDCDAAVRSPQLAMENAESAEISLNGVRVRAKPAGWWVDESIRTIKLPSLSAGRHELVVSIPFTRKTDVEWCYLLGDFGVAVAGRNARIVSPVRKLAWGDWTHQGLPFYAGNVIYHCALVGGGREMRLEVPKFKNPLLSVDRNGKPAGKIAFAPYQLSLGKFKGPQKLTITAFGNRANAFGALHHTNEQLTWVGPAAWRSEGTSWSYEYNFKRMGILTAPILHSLSR